jgi:hypothetical protein
LKQPKQVRRRREEALIVNAPRPQVWPISGIHAGVKSSP